MKLRLDIFLAFVTFALILAACDGGDGPTATAPVPTSTIAPIHMTVTLKDTTSLEDLRELFNRDLGQTRIVLLLSPT